VLAILSGCGGMTVVGLHPVYPPLEKRVFATHCEFVEVDSLQPTFQWQPFPRPADDFAVRIQDVSYELGVWTMTQGPSGRIRYSREGLKLPSHKLEEPLEPSILYLWSVRAHFMFDGNSRVTEWGMAGLALRNESVPNLSCFRFKTLEPRP
jgi:hypothetical protein